jgi:hypothetical protein
MSTNDVTEDRRAWDELIARAHKLDRAYVKVGVLEEKGGDAIHEDSDMTLVEIAATHEFGNEHIPERSFIRATFLVRRVNALASMQARLAKAIVTKGLDPKRALGMLGSWGAAEVKNTFTEIDIPPPLADSTIMAKGSSKPLIDTAQLKNSISYQVIENEAADMEPSRTEMPRRS